MALNASQSAEDITSVTTETLCAGNPLAAPLRKSVQTLME